MSEDNIVVSDDVAPKPKKKAPAKKAVAKKAVVADDTTHQETAIPTDTSGVVIIFESGASYSTGDYRFTQDTRVQEVPTDVAERLLALDNFRLPSPFELEEYLKSREV